MAPRRGQGGYASTLSPADQPPSSPLGTNFPRSTSPSSGLAQFLTKPSKWFRSTSASSKMQNTAPELPRPSVSSARKPKISRPTDPRPILESYAAATGSKSVLDLSARPPGSLDIPPPQPTSTPSSPATGPSHGYGNGDLRAISRKGWSKSADDLSQLTPSHLTPVKTSFQDKIQEYRNRSNSSASAASPPTPTSPSIPYLSRHPFPSSSPPRSSTLPAVSISISAPALDESQMQQQQQQQQQSQQVHTRSRSFTPKQPSKLASPRIVTNSPQRKGSAPLEREMDTTGERPSPTHGPTRSSTFPFAFNAQQPPSVKPETPSSLLSLNPHAQPPSPLNTKNRQTAMFLSPPPASASAPSELNASINTNEDSKRSSQIVYHSGFINRLPDVPGNYHYGSHALAKGWKPFKLELKGSKLHFYKPPSDRSTAVKELFPTAFVPGLGEEEEEAVEMDVDDGKLGVKGREELPGSIGRKKRAFWGRRTHPELVWSKEGVESGTFEALVHEAVFATTFLTPATGEEKVVVGESESESGEQKSKANLEEWKNFASAILLCLPSLVGQGKFEVEFLRCCSYLVGGAGDDEKESETERVEWLAGEYLRYHGVPANLQAWNEWRRDILPNSSSAIVQNSSAAAPIMTTSTSMQAIHQSSPQLTGSPNLFGTDDNPHWLTKLVLLLVLGADTSTAHVTQSQSLQTLNPSSGGRPPEETSRPTQSSSRTHSRSEVISAWARVAELCRLAGDDCTFRAIAAALTSRPVARLDKVWRRVDRLAVNAVESWVNPATGTSDAPVGVKEPRVTVWGGEVRLRVKELLARAEGEDIQGVKVGPLGEVRALFEDIRTEFSLCPRKVPPLQGEVNDDLKRMMTFWREVATDGGGIGSIAAKFQRVEQFMSLSLAAEPRRKGLFEPHFWSRQSSGQAPHMSLLPLLFPEPMPSVCLVDRAQLLRGRLDSDASDTQLRRAMDPHRHPNLRTLPTDQTNNSPNLTWGGTVIPVYNGDLLLVVQVGGGGSDSNPNSRPSSSRMSSRPPSSVVDSEKTPLSRTPSIRVKPGSSQGLERKASVARRNSLPSISHRQSLLITEPSSEPPLRVMVQAGTLNTLVGILVHGLRNVSVSVADDNGEMSLREGMTRELIVDRAEFAKIWWNVFRSFVTPLVFFEEGQNLVNFDKRRYLCNLIEKAPTLPSLQRRFQPDEFNRRGFERLNNVEKEVILLQFDHRGIKEEALREATLAPALSTRKLSRPFQRILVVQLEKNRRDKNLRSRLQKEKLHEQSRLEKRDDMLNRAMRPRKPSQKQHRNKKSMSALFHFMRPISSAFGADLPSSPIIKKTATELDFVPSGKPSLVLSLVDARVAQFINNERPFTFQLDTEDGGHYLLQAMNKRDMTKWIETISKVATMAAKRRLTYLGPKPQLADHIHSHIVPSRDPKAVFGVELDFLLQREAEDGPAEPGAIPFVIEQCLSEVEAMQLDNLENRLRQIRSVVQGLPQANFDLLRRVAEHLDRVTDFEEQNHMTAEALAIVFSPNLLRSPQNDFNMILANMGHTHKLVKALITHFHVIFDDTDAEEAEVHSEDEDEYDSPIPEEDEEDDATDLHVPQTLESEQASLEADYSKQDTPA
ncbi:hypothetical protein H0H93_011142 [Arthromyces matolae]|nr:hypothetical protein H0H93_011142 [Arthromyces matolae]